MKLFLTITLLLTLVACSYSESDLEGTYVSSKIKNNIDTLILKNNGDYYRGLYTKSEKSLILRQYGKWRVKSNQLVLYQFHIDYDNVYSKSRKFDSGLMDVYLNISSGPSFDYGAFNDGTMVYERLD